MGKRLTAGGDRHGGEYADLLLITGLSRTSAGRKTKDANRVRTSATV
jgi:hypothetical protein